MRRSTHLFVGGSIFIGGFVVMSLLLRVSGLTTIIGVFSVGLASPVGAGKLASP
jgi:hypothetical protein